MSKTKSNVFVEFALHPQHQTSLDSGIQLLKFSTTLKASQERDLEACRWSH